MVSHRILLLLTAGIASGCFRLKEEDFDAAMDQDADGAIAAAYGGTDCDDTDRNIGPHADELCDSIDNDCDGDIDENDAVDAISWFRDGDGDGQGNPADEVLACTAPEERVAVAGDCDDVDPAIYEGATEVCNEVDDDCDGLTDEGDAEPGTWYLDDDGDGFGDPDNDVVTCTPDDDYVLDDTDCDDTDPAVNPEADEVCDEVDNDCDTEVDEDDAVDAPSWVEDADGDGVGTNSPGGVVVACEAPTNYVDTSGDCDDADPLIYPGADEVCDGADNNCDSVVDFELNVPSADHATIQSAIDVVGTSERICVAPGTYTERLSITRDVVLHGQDRDTTIIDGGGGGSVVSVAGGSGGTELQGFTITGGSGSQGAAIYASAAAGTFADLLITDNTGTSGGQCTGSIVYSNGAVQPTWHNVDFIGNTVICGEAWGLIYARSGTAVLENVRFIDNVMQGESYLYGMAIAYNGRIEITNGVFAGNRGQAPSGSSVDIRGLIAGGIVSSFSLENVTIVGNEVDAGGGTALGGLFFVEDGFSGSLNNVTMTSNTFDDTSIVASVAWGSVAQSHSNVYDMDTPRYSGSDPTGLLGNISVDPGFVDVSSSDPTVWDLQLDTGSLLIDAGDTAILDPDGSTSDIGAHGGPGAASW